MEPGEFRGVVGRYHHESTAWWPEPSRAPAGAPNVLLVVLDDVGFAQLGCFGSDIDTPVLDGLAAGGLRFTGFHTTALCSPTRSCLMTGRNHHTNGMGRVTELAMGFPGYDARIPRANGFVSEILGPAGWATYAVGKWHLTPEEETNLAASRARWPLRRGFDRFYGFFDGETHQFVPALVCDNHQVLPPRAPEDGYHLTEDLVDHAVEMLTDLRQVDPDKPFLLWFCPGACHSPHQAPPEWIERYRGRFDGGWDRWRTETLARQVAAGVVPPGTELSPRPEWVPAWDALSADEQRLYARYMEAFAGFLSHADHEIGRLLDHLRRLGDLDDTLVIVLSDNGASSEGGPVGSTNDNRIWNGVPHEVAEAVARIHEIGGPRMHNNYPWGWTVAGNTPFRRWKREVHEGGVADPMIVHWPERIRARGGIRRQYVHAVDVMPTILEATGVEAPPQIDGVPQSPIAGTSFVYTFDDVDAPSRRETQYYEMFGSRAIYHRGWKAVTYHPMQVDEPGFDDDRWELYHVDEDLSECHDLADQHPEKLRELVERWWIEAARHGALPLDNRAFSELVFGRPRAVPARRRYVYLPGAAAVPEEAAVNVRNRSHTITADVDVPAGGADGVLLAQGSLLGGWSLFVRDGRLRYVHNLAGRRLYRVDADADIAPGRHTLTFRYERSADHQGDAELLVDGRVVGAGEIRRFTPTRFSLTGAGLTCGYGDGLPVSDEYDGRFPFTGTIHTVTVEVDGEPFVDADGEAEQAIARQ